MIILLKYKRKSELFYSQENGDRTEDLKKRHIIKEIRSIFAYNTRIFYWKDNIILH